MGKVVDETDVIVLFNVFGIPEVHDHTFGTVRCASAAPITNIVLRAVL